MSHLICQFGQDAVRWLVICAVVVLVGAGPARAINWEGHDEPALQHADIHKFTDGVPPPIAKPLPSCAERTALWQKNRYEQVPIKGVNCVGE